MVKICGLLNWTAKVMCHMENECVKNNKCVKKSTKGCVNL